MMRIVHIVQDRKMEAVISCAIRPDKVISSEPHSISQVIGLHEGDDTIPFRSKMESIAFC